MKFFSVTKPGIIFGNIVTVVGGYLLGSQGNINFWSLFVTVLGMAFVVASGCVFNNYIDRDIDLLMERTKHRAIATGIISGKIAILYAIFLGTLGVIILYLQTNLLTVFIALLGLFVYVASYSLWLKRKSSYGTAMGGIAGAVPPVVGYCAVTNNVDIGAVLLFAILFLWQMPHFYAIAIYRLHDFAAAQIPVLPIKRSIHYTKVSMLFYIVAFTVVAVMPALLGYAGLSYFVAASLAGLIWLGLGLRGFNSGNDRIWARKMFSFSILNIMALCIMMWSGFR